MTAQRAPAELRRFVEQHEGVEALVQRIGRETFDLLLIDQEGNWTRAVFLSEEECKETAADLGVEQVHDGWDDEGLAKRMSRRDHWNEPGGQRRAL